MTYTATRKPKGKKFFYEVFADGKLVGTRTSHNTYISATVHQRGDEVWYVTYSSKMKVRNENAPGVVSVLVPIEEVD